MTRIKFFTPIIYDTKTPTASQSFHSAVDHYFYFGGKKAYLIPGTSTATLQNEKSPFWLTLLKVISYLTFILPFFMLALKARLRSGVKVEIVEKKKAKPIPLPPPPLPPPQPPPDPNVILNPRTELEKGINLKHETVEEIVSLLPDILKKKENAKIKWLAKARTLVFSLKSAPGLVFKVGDPKLRVPSGGKFLNANESMGIRYKNMITAQEVCLKHKLTHLVIPNAKKFVVKLNQNYVFTAERRLDFNHTESAQEQQFFLNAKKMDETIRQLAVFIAETGFSDVTWRNIPLLNSAGEGHKKIGLIDLEDFGLPDIGLFGNGWKHRGLINCLFSEKHIDIVLEEAAKKKIDFESDVKNKRLPAIKMYRELHRFFEEKGILNNQRQLVHIDDFNSLGLNLEEEAEIDVEEPMLNENGDEEMVVVKKTVKLKTVLQEVVDAINGKITTSDGDKSIKDQRNLTLRFKNGKLQPYRELGKIAGDESKSWVNRIIQALVARGHIFKIERTDSDRYLVQA